MRLSDYFHDREASKVPSLVSVPEELKTYVDVAIELYNRVQAGGRFGLDDLSEILWAALLGITQGVNRAQNEKLTKK